MEKIVSNPNDFSAGILLNYFGKTYFLAALAGLPALAARTLAQRALCAAAILLRPAAEMVRVARGAEEVGLPCM